MKKATVILALLMFSDIFAQEPKIPGDLKVVPGFLAQIKVENAEEKQVFEWFACDENKVQIIALNNEKSSVIVNIPPNDMNKNIRIEYQIVCFTCIDGKLFKSKTKLIINDDKTPPICTREPP